MPLLASLARAPVAHSAFPGHNGYLAFSKRLHGNDDIYRMNPNGRGLRRLTQNSAFDANPSFAPSGSRIAFQSDRDGKGEIYVMRADGSHKRRLTDNGASDIDPAFSGPRGKQIAFSSDRGHPDHFDLYVMRADGSHVRRVAGGRGDELSPAFSPSGKKIAFSNNVKGMGDIYVMRAKRPAQAPADRQPGTGHGP